MIRKYEVIVKLRTQDADAVDDSNTEHVLFTVTNSRPRAQVLADSCAFLIGQTVTDMFVRAANSVQEEE